MKLSSDLCEEWSALWETMSAKERWSLLIHSAQRTVGRGIALCPCAGTTTKNSTDAWYQAECAATSRRSTTSTSTISPLKWRQILDNI